MPPFGKCMDLDWELKLQWSEPLFHQLPSTSNSSLKIGFLKGFGCLFYSSSYLNDAMAGDTLGCYHTLRGDFKASNTPCMQHYLAALSHTFVLYCLNIWRGLSCFVIALQPSGEHGRQISSAEWNSSELDSVSKNFHPWFVQTKAFSRMY